MEELKKLGFWDIPYSNRVELALKLKGVKYEYIEEDLSNKSPQLLKYNPIQQKISVLVHNGKPISDSALILEYIDETWKCIPPLLPEDPYERAMARFWAKFIDDKCLPAMWKACWDKGKGQQRAKEDVLELLKILNDELKGKKFFGGDAVGFVDIIANFVGFWLGVIQEAMETEFMKKEEHPRLCQWVEDFVNYRMIEEYLPPRQITRPV